MMMSVAPSTFLPFRGFPLFSNKGDLRKLSRYTPRIQSEPATGVKSSLSPGRDLAIKEVRINPERYTTDQLPIETDLLELFVVGKERIKRSKSKQQFVGFEPSPPPPRSVSWHKAQAEVRKEERKKMLPLCFEAKNRHHLHSPVGLDDSSSARAGVELGATDGCVMKSYFS